MRSIRPGATVIAPPLAGSAFANAHWSGAPFADAMAPARGEGTPLLPDFHASSSGLFGVWDRGAHAGARGMNDGATGTMERGIAKTHGPSRTEEGGKSFQESARAKVEAR